VQSLVLRQVTSTIINHENIDGGPSGTGMIFQMVPI